MTAAGVLDLGEEGAAFARGGNRLCFVDPRHPERCIKVLRADRSPAQKRREATPIKRLKPLSRFDDNQQEAAVYRRIEGRIGSAAFELVPRLHGFVATSLGPGLCSELLRDDDGRIAITLKQYLWQHGESASLAPLLEHFCARWRALGMPSRHLLLHNIVLQYRGGQPAALKVIDGLGWPDLLPLAWYLPPLARRKAGQRARRLHSAILSLLDKRASGGDFGIHGWLDDTRRHEG
ncbi:MAG: YrbL family protein [Parahaliea sp.]